MVIIRLLKGATLSLTLLTALGLQAIMLTLLRHRLGQHWLRRPVTLLVITSVIYEGLSPVLLTIPSINAQNVYRLGVAQHFTDQATLLMSAGMLALTVAYLLTRPERVMGTPGENDLQAVVKVLDWRFLAVACVPLAVLTVHGKGYNSTLGGVTGTPVTVALATTFFVILVVLTGFSLVLTYGRRWFLPVLIGQSFLLAAAGERTPVIVDAVVLIVLLGHAGMRPRARQLQAAAALTVIAVLAITGVRAQQGRDLYYQDNGLAARVSALGGGLSTITSGTPGQSAAGHGLLGQAAIRLDGVHFAGAVLQSISFGQPRLSAAYVPESLLIAVPSMVWAGKIGKLGVTTPTTMELYTFGLQEINFLPSFTGLYTGFLSPGWLVAFLAGLGWLAGLGERRLFREWTPARVVWLAGAITAATWRFEAGLPAMVVTLRTALVLAVCVKAVEALRVRKSRRYAAS